jgi:hypothetical protein
MPEFQGAGPALCLLLLSIASTVAADRPAVAAADEFMSFAAKPASDVQHRPEDVFAALGISPMATKAQARLPSREEPREPSNSVLIFGGQFTTDNLGNTLNPFGTHHENQRIVAAAYGHDFYRSPSNFVLGTEIGAGFRFGSGSSQELWAGISVRHTGFVLFGLVRIAGGITIGLSAVTKAVGIEAEREIKDHGSAQILAYLGPELTLALPQYPNLEFVYRVQHRSGAYGLIANFIEGANANVFGVRYRF